MNRFTRVSAAVLLSLAAGSSHAMTYVMMTDTDLVAQASEVVSARVTSVTPVMDADGRFALGTRYTLDVHEWLRGTARTSTQTLYLPGTPNADTAGAWIVGVPRFVAGDEVLVVAQRNASGDLVPVQLSLGMFQRVTGTLGEIYVRTLGDATNPDPQRNALFGLARSAAPFEAALRAPVFKVADYFAHDEVPDTRFTQIRGNDGNPVRWFEFDSSTNVSWRAVSGGQAGMVTDEFAQVQQAVAAWANDPGSRITVSYGGTVASDQGNNGTDGNNTVIWNDPGGDIAGAFNCTSGGTLAIGGPFFTNSTTTFAGVPYHDAVEGFVIVQDNAGCFFDGGSGTNGAETLAHEIGHALGLGHSCGDGSSPACGAAGSVLNQAVMRASVHGDGRGAALGTDDRAAMAVIYPDPAGNAILFANGFE